MLVLIPAHCNCTATVSWLIAVAAGAGAQTFLVDTTSTTGEVERLYQRLGSRIRAQANLALAPDDKLRDSIPDDLAANGLTAILVGIREPVHYATGLSPRDDAQTLIRALTH